MLCLQRSTLVPGNKEIACAGAFVLYMVFQIKAEPLLRHILLIKAGGSQQTCSYLFFYIFRLIVHCVRISFKPADVLSNICTLIVVVH